MPRRPAPPPWTPEQTRDAAAVYARMGLRALGARLGMCHRVVRRRLVAAGVQIRRPGPPVAVAWPHLVDLTPAERAEYDWLVNRKKVRSADAIAMIHAGRERAALRRAA